MAGNEQRPGVGLAGLPHRLSRGTDLAGDLPIAAGLPDGNRAQRLPDPARMRGTRRKVDRRPPATGIAEEIGRVEGNGHRCRLTLALCGRQPGARPCWGYLALRFFPRVPVGRQEPSPGGTGPDERKRCTRRGAALRIPGQGTDVAVTRRPRHDHLADGLDIFLDPGRLAGPVAQVVKLRAAHLAPPLYLDVGHQRAVGLEGPLDPGSG